MAILDCTVESCTYNKNRGCKRDEIIVEGKHASNCEETCCGSFQPKKNKCKCEDK